MTRLALTLDRRSILWIMAILAGTVLFVFFVTRPQLHEISALQAQAKKERAEFTQGAQSPQAVAALEQEVKALADKTANFDVKIPHEAMMGNILEELARMTEQRKLRTETIKPAEPVQADNISMLPIDIRVRGSFTNVFGLIQDIENMDRLARIERLSTTSENEMPGQVAAEVNIKVFFRTL